MLDDISSIQRFNRIYYAYINRNSSSNSPFVRNGFARQNDDSELTATEEIFARPMVLLKLGQFIMDVKVNKYID